MSEQDAPFHASLGLGVVTTGVLGRVAIAAFVIMIASGLSAFFGFDTWGWLSTKTPRPTSWRVDTGRLNQTHASPIAAQRGQSDGRQPVVGCTAG